MSDVAIHVEGLGKCYRIEERRRRPATVAQAVRRTLTSPFSYFMGSLRKPTAEETLWALKDVTFDVKHGEVFGLIGRNGAGKSTLLKVLSRITEPTEGRAAIHGRVASLLEVGTGFHPELTGRENIYLNGAILGMRKGEIDRRFDEIVAFSEVEKFIDTPVKRYSSGMYVRLAFAVAAHLEPEVLLVDEVLAVGDAGFQKKCLAKMGDVSRAGKTVLLVSHNMGSIAALCDRAVVLRQGKLDYIGEVGDAVTSYLKQFGEDAATARHWSWDDAPSGQKVRVRDIVVSDEAGVQKQYYSCTEPVRVTIDYWVLNDGAPVNAHFYLFDEKNNMIFAVGNYSETSDSPIVKPGLYRSVCTIPGNLLNAGKHTLEVDMVVNLSDIDVHMTDRVAFETVDDQRVHSRYKRWAGIIKPDFPWKTERVGEKTASGVTAGHNA